jgi:hypothetical protein
MERNVEVQNASAAMFDDEKTVQRSETKVGNREEIESGDNFAMVVQKSEPLIGLVFLGDALEALEIARHGRFGDVETEQ